MEVSPDAIRKLADISIHLKHDILSLLSERNFAIPDTVDAHKRLPACKVGLLPVTLPKQQIPKPRAIKVNIPA